MTRKDVKAARKRIRRPWRFLAALRAEAAQFQNANQRRHADRYKGYVLKNIMWADFNLARSRLHDAKREGFRLP